jgi:protocatechuate 3,4-dioxygenase beta subunit
VVIGIQGEEDDEIARAKTDAEGRYELRGFDEGEARVRLDLSAAPQWRSHPDHWIPDYGVETEAGETTVKFILAAVPAVRFRVIDAATKQPITNARIERWTHHRDGEFVVVRVIPGRKTLRVSAPGYAPTSVVIEVPQADLTLKNAVELHRGVTLAGRVLDGTPTPLANAMVWVERLDRPTAEAPKIIQAARTSKAGEYQSVLLAPGRYRLLAVAPGFASDRQTIELFADKFGLDISLQRRDETVQSPATEHDWTSRRDLPVEMECANIPADELVEWLEAVAGVRVKRDEGVMAKLRHKQVSPSFGGTPLRLALNFVASVSGLELDQESGTLRVKRR